MRGERAPCGHVPRLPGVRKRTLASGRERQPAARRYQYEPRGAAATVSQRIHGNQLTHLTCRMLRQCQRRAPSIIGPPLQALKRRGALRRQANAQPLAARSTKAPSVRTQPISAANAPRPTGSPERHRPSSPRTQPAWRTPYASERGHQNPQRTRPGQRAVLSAIDQAVQERSQRGVLRTRASEDAGMRRSMALR